MMDADQFKALDAYTKALHVLTLERGRKTQRWQLAQAATIRRLLLNGTCLVFQNPAQHVGMRKVVKGDKG